MGYFPAKQVIKTCSGIDAVKVRSCMTLFNAVSPDDIFQEVLDAFYGGSSAASGTVKTLRELLPDFDVVAPDMPVDPAEALPFLRGLCMNEVPDVVVGTSMGGMYAQMMSTHP